VGGQGQGAGGAVQVTTLQSTPQSVLPVVRPPSRVPRGRRPDLALRLLNLPALVLTLAVGVAPLLAVAFLSFQNLRLGSPVSGGLVGWSNYAFVLADRSVATAFRNTLYFSALSVAIATGVGLGIALLMNDESLGLSRWLILGIVLPWAVPEIVNALVWQWIFNPAYGALNGLLVALHVLRDYRAWLSTPASAMHAVVFAYSWKLVPFAALVLYAALRSIAAELYECAQLDGANGWAQFRHISWPLITPAVAVVVLFGAVWSMRAFDIVYLLTGGGPGEATMLLSYFTFTKAFQFGDLGAGAAVACLLVIITLAMTVVYWRMLPREAPQ
jgi:multiple sugar transport system permease protein